MPKPSTKKKATFNHPWRLCGSIAMLMLTAILLSSFRGNDALSLLTSQDYELEIAERTSGLPALSSPMDEEPWESFTVFGS